MLEVVDWDILDLQVHRDLVAHKGLREIRVGIQVQQVPLPAHRDLGDILEV
jgi:hypothetical protein